MIIPFGKYKGLDANHVVQTDRPYIEWMMNSYIEKENDEKWGAANKKRAEELRNILQLPPQARSIVQEAKEQVEIAQVISSKREAEISQKHNEVMSIEAKLNQLDEKLEQLIKDVAIISWFVKGGAEAPEVKPVNPAAIKWEE